MDTNVLGQYIREYRKKNKLTQQAFADLMFVSNKTVSRWETGRGEPDIDQLARISELLDIPVGTLIGGVSLPEDGSGIDAASAKRKFRPAIAVVCILLVLAAAALTPILIFAFRPPEDSGPAPETVADGKFEAEWADLKAMNPQLDGNDSFVERADTASNSMCIAYFGANGNTATFEIISSAADENAMLYIAVVSRWNNVHEETPFDEVWELYVNEEKIKTGKTYRSPDDNNPYHDFVEVSVGIKLTEGRNIIKLVCPETGDGLYGLNTDYLRIETGAALSWHPNKENKIRPPE